MSGSLWFLLVTIILAKPVLDDRGLGETDARLPGDIIQSALLGGAVTREKCEEGGALAARAFQQAGGDSVAVVYSCVEMDAAVGDHQGFEATGHALNDLIGEQP